MLDIRDIVFEGLLGKKKAKSKYKKDDNKKGILN
jgi:hypothetical protein